MRVKQHKQEAEQQPGRSRAIRANTLNASNANPQFNVFFCSSGTGLIWANLAPTGYTSFVSLHSMRKNNNTYAQSATPNSWDYCGTEFNGTGSA